MDEIDNEKRSQIHRKRKVEAEQFDLPIPKYVCWDHHLSSKPLSILEENQEDLFTHIIAESPERQAIEDGSDPESVKDSNSCTGDFDSAMSVCVEAKFETEISKPFNGPSSSLLFWDCNNFKDTQCSSEDAAATGSAGKLAFVEGELDPYHYYDELHQNVDEPIFEGGSCSAYTYPECEIDIIEPCIDKEIDDILYPKGVNPNIYVLSSGRWSVNQDAQPGTRKPTIDQEFEKYFSMLML